MKGDEIDIIQQEPIAAVATAVSQSAIAIVRMSGKGVLDCGNKIFKKHKSKTFSFLTAPSHTAHYGSILNKDGDLVDEVVAILYRSPGSYTKEDSIEINCHGGKLVTEEVLRATLDAGCRLAEPGEFTKRAFLNGRIDLPKAESIGELIQAKTTAAKRSAISHLKGDLSKKLSSLRTELLKACAMLELEFDFSEEDVEFQSRKELIHVIEQFLKETHILLRSFQLGKAIQEGIKIAIAGKPNVGKSTLLNAVLGKPRAIVSQIAGTTRDYLQESFDYEGLLCQLIDTAGLRVGQSDIESEGIRRSMEMVQAADVIFYVFDVSSSSLKQEQQDIGELSALCPHATIIPIGNKLDLVTNLPSDNEESEAIYLSARDRHGMGVLFERLKEIASESQATQEGSVLITNVRHYEALQEAYNALVDAKEALDQRSHLDLVASSLNAALHSVALITGDVVQDDILNFIFSKFCIGK